MNDIVTGVAKPRRPRMGVVKAEGKSGKTVFEGKGFDELVYL